MDIGELYNVPKKIFVVCRILGETSGIITAIIAIFYRVLLMYQTYITLFTLPLENSVRNVPLS